MLDTMRIAAIEIAARQNAFTFGQVHPALCATHHLLNRSGWYILLGRWPAKRLQQQVDNHNNGQQKK